MLDKREARIRNMFGNIAPSYDLLNHLLSLNVDRYWRWRTTRLVPPAGDGPILDLCTGTGDLALAYDRAAQRPGADRRRRLLPRDALPGARPRPNAARPRSASASSKPMPSGCRFPTASFRSPAVAFGLRNVTDTDRGIAEMVRVTRPGGKVAILEFSQPRPGCSAGCTASTSATCCRWSAR